MSKKVLVSLDMNKNEIQNVVMQSLATAPTSPKEGQYYYNSADGKAYQYVSTSASGVTPATYAWKPLGGAEITVDSAMSDSSTNPVQNKVVKKAIRDAIAALPKEQFLDLTKTTFVQSFAWSSTSYPGSTNPSLEGKPVLVLALKNSSDNTVAYSFLNMYELVDTYTADSPINVSGRKIIHVNSGVTAGSYGSTSAQAPNFGETVNMPYTTVDATGHVTAAGTATVKIPNNVATTEKAGLMSASDKDKLDNTLKLKKAKLVIDPSNTSATATLSVSSPEIIAVEAMYYDDSKGDGYEAVIVDWESDGPTFKASIAQAETQLSIWIHVLYI